MAAVGPDLPALVHAQHLERLIAAYLTHDAERGRERTVREFVAEFRGLSGTAKQKAVLEATGLAESSAGRAVRRPRRSIVGASRACSMP